MSTAKRTAHSPLEKEEKRSCLQDSFSSSDDTIITSNVLSSTLMDTPAGDTPVQTLGLNKEEFEQRVQLALFNPNILEVLSKALAAQVTNDLRTEIIELKRIIKEKDEKIEKLYDRIDDLEQYGRRNNIRINNIPETDGENTDAIVKSIAKAIDVDLIDNDIERSHRLGRKQDGIQNKPRSIIVKFCSYRQKRGIMVAKKKLSQLDPTKTFPTLKWPALSTPSTPGSSSSSRRSQGAGDQRARPVRIFVNEDLTGTRAHLAGLAREKKRDGRISDTWTRDGVIYIKKGGTTHRVTTEGELRAIPGVF